jgi:hypothetical protein
MLANTVNWTAPNTAQSADITVSVSANRDTVGFTDNVSLTASVDDPDGDAITVTWTAPSVPEDVTMATTADGGTLHNRVPDSLKLSGRGKINPW